jgi:hypothetical protein
MANKQQIKQMSAYKRLSVEQIEALELKIFEAFYLIGRMTPTACKCQHARPNVLSDEWFGFDYVINAMVKKGLVYRSKGFYYLENPKRKK